MHWQKSRAFEEWGRLKMAVEGTLYTAFEDGNASEIDLALQDIAGAAALLKREWRQFLDQPMDEILLTDERTAVLERMIPDVMEAYNRWHAALKAHWDTPVEQASRRSAASVKLAAARAELESRLKKHMRPLEVLRKEAMAQ